MFRQFAEKYPVVLVLGFFFLGLGVAWGLQAGRSVSAATAAQESALPVSQTAESSSPSVAAAPAGLVWANCTADNVAVFTNRVHVRCSADVNGIWYFAYPTADDAEAARVLSLLTSAQVTGRLLQVLYDPADTTTGPPISCNANDCRVMTAVALY